MTENKVRNNSAQEGLLGLSSMSLEVDELYEDLEPFVELAKYITNSSICEINIFDTNYQWSLAGYDKHVNVMSKQEGLRLNTVKEGDIYEILDLSVQTKNRDESSTVDNPKLKYHCEAPLKTSDGSNIGTICVMDANLKNLPDSQKQQLQHIADMIVHRLQLWNVLQKVQFRVNELRDSFHKLNHEIRSPINGIIGILGMLITEEPEVTVSTEKLETVTSCARTVVEMVESVLEHVEDSNKSAGQSDLKQVVTNLHRLYSLQAEKKDIALKIQSSSIKDAKVSDYFVITLMQIAGNLVANSIKFTSQKGDVQVALSREKSGNIEAVNMIVSDNGRGMSAEQVAAFNAGTEVDRHKGTEGEKSYGLGLEHIKSMVKKFKGSVEVYSTEGKGTTFRVWLPIK